MSPFMLVVLAMVGYHTPPPQPLPVMDTVHVRPVPSASYEALRSAGVGHKKAARLARLFDHYGEEANVDPKLLIAIASVESDFTPTARSQVGAVGMMQIMPDRRSWGKYEDECGARMTRANLRDPETNICFGAYIYSWFKQYHHDRKKALNAYNNGVGYDNGYAKKVLSVMRSL